MLFATVNGEKLKQNLKHQGLAHYANGLCFQNAERLMFDIGHIIKMKAATVGMNQKRKWHKNWKLVFGKDN